MSSLYARDIIQGALRKLGALASGEAMQASEGADGLQAFNLLLDSWSTESLLIPNKVRETFPLSPSQASYTMGVGGNFNTTRPMLIEHALIQLAGSNPLVEIPLHIYTEDQFAKIPVKTLQSTLPQVIYAEGTFPVETINLYPVPTVANTLILYSAKQLLNLPNLSTQLSLPPGYERALVYNLALELAPEYGKQVSQEVVGFAAASKAEVKRKNIAPKYMELDSFLSARRKPYDWRTDT